MSATTPRSALPLLAAAQAQKHVTHNEALLQLDALVFARFLDRDLTAPPASPADGDTYLVHAAATGDWSGQDGAIAYAVDSAWRFYAPFAGLAAFVVDEARLIIFNGTAWVDYASVLNLSNIPLVGVNTTADATNKLAVKSSAVLFDNVGNGLQAKINKHASGDTASLLYQTNYSGRAEIGLTGDDDFHFKVSPDGAAWFDGFDINRADGSVDFLASEATLASAATTDLGTAPSLEVNVTGTTAITSFGTAAHALRFVRFAGALTLTHNATSLILLGGASRTTAAGDTGLYTSDAAGNWRERAFFRAASNPGDIATRTGTETLANKTLASPSVSGPLAISTGTTGANASLTIGNTVPAASALAYFTNSAGRIMLFGYTGPSYSAGEYGVIDVIGNFPFRFCTNDVPRFVIAGDGSSITPGGDNVTNFGSAAARWATLYAGTGAINTSGAATKDAIRPLSAAEAACARDVSALVRAFRFRDAVAAKGDAARLHVGMIHEEVVAAFAAHGLDPLRYGIVCRDAGPDGAVLGLRYDELAQFVIAGLAARLAALEG